VGEKVKLHLGCGKRYLPGFLHIDIDNSVEHLDHCSDISDLSMFADDSVDEIYTCGAIGYYDPDERSALFEEWHRVLKKNGTLRISVVDFEKQIEVYLNSNKNLTHIGVMGPIFGIWNYKDKNGVDRKAYKKTAYDFDTLRDVLLGHGFFDYKRYNWKDFLPDNYDDFSAAYVPHMDENGVHIMLNIECKKT
jgi:predicted SAM-dependent methyltransferase